MSGDTETQLIALREQVRALDFRMNKFEDVCSGCRANVNGKFDGVADQMRRLDDRLRALEIRVAFYAGGAALLGTVAGALISKLF